MANSTCFLFPAPGSASSIQLHSKKQASHWRQCRCPVPDDTKSTAQRAQPSDRERRLKSLARQGVRPDKTRPSSSSSMTKGRRTATDDDGRRRRRRRNPARRKCNGTCGSRPTTHEVRSPSSHHPVFVSQEREREQRSRGLPSAVLGLKGKPLNEGKVSSVVQTLIVPGAVPACGHPTVVKGPWIRRYVRVGSPLVFRMPCAMPFRVSSLRYPAGNDGSCTSTRIPSDCCLPQDDARGMVRREHVCMYVCAYVTQGHVGGISTFHDARRQGGREPVESSAEVGPACRGASG